MYPIVHTADLHLDYKNKQIQKTTAEGRNIREVDFFRVFEELVDKVIDLRPKAFVIAGDLFDTPRPSNAVVKSTINLFNKLESAGIVTIVEAGNHDTPQMRTTTSTIESLGEIEYKYIHFIYYNIERIVVDDAEFIVVPHLGFTDGFDPELIKPDYKNNKYSVLILHGVADGSDIFKQLDESREMPLGAHILNMGHTYIALGHYHKRSQVRKNAWYSGSLENGSFGPDVQHEKGGFLVDLEKMAKEPYEPELIPVKTREIIDFGEYDAMGQTAPEIEKGLLELTQSRDISEALVRVKVIHITKNIYSNIDKALVQSFGRDALYFKVNWVITQIQSASGTDALTDENISNEKIQDLETEWKSAVDHRYGHDETESLPEKEKVVDKGIEYLRTYSEGSNVTTD